MMKLVKGLFSSSNNQEKKPESSFNEEFVLVNWYEEGKSKSQSHGGSESGLITCIGKIYHNHKEILRRDEIEQEKAKKPFKSKQQELKSKNEFNNLQLNKIKSEDIPKIKNKIEKIQDEIHDIKKNPQNYIGSKVGKVGFYIGLIILLFLTFYLFIFYSSASYSSFFKIFTLNELGVANSIFDAKALSKALNDGMTELFLILTIPFVFIGLGYLIHKFQEGKSWVRFPKIAMLILVTFVFDCILAYEITEKIYSINAENSFQKFTPYSISLAFDSVNFWLIIFAGFVVYIIWGFVFDFVMDAYGKLDQVNILLKTKREGILNEEKHVDECENEINKINKNIADNNIEIEKLKTILDHSDIIKPKELEHSLMIFLDGWLEYLQFNSKPEATKENARSAVSKFIIDNVKPMEISSQ